MKRKILGVTLGAVFVLAMMTNPVFASSPDLTVTSVNAEDGTLTMTVQGTAGATTPDEPSDIYAYVIVTNADGIYAVTSHFGVDDDDADGDLDWHSHQVELNDAGCVTSINSAGVASLDGNTITVTGTGAEEATTGLSAVLSIDDEGNICVKQVFSSL